MSDFARYYSDIEEWIDNPTDKSYAFDIKEQENHEGEEQESYEKRQMEKLRGILYYWKDRRWDFAYLMGVKD